MSEYEAHVLKTENKKLQIICDSLKADNEKLRELASEAWELLTCNEPAFVWSGLQEKARELGIEVPS